ncbi:hypothetical protein M997_1704 [Proteus hauseri ATCC 700826]|uniref:Uncharacterized protein n=1 Tax=Proteus hauseri ATCC 700826 TaxID=1354271 RepID=A0AAJ3HSL7_PROHU|nr:hypothetical protein [Proteus hauseri]OAT47177.1 hypothetical protein M997_1704 [Proteus hauseri ATCC 700826]
MATFDLLKAANEMILTEDKITQLKEHLKIEENKFKLESKKRLVDEQLLSKAYEA